MVTKEQLEKKYIELFKKKRIGTNDIASLLIEIYETHLYTIASYPNQVWEKQVFPNNKNAYEKLYMSIMETCIHDRQNPVQAWNDFFSTCWNGYKANK